MYQAQDTRANPNSWKTHLVRKRWDIGLLRALSPRIMMMMMTKLYIKLCITKTLVFLTFLSFSNFQRCILYSVLELNHSYSIYCHSGCSLENELSYFCYNYENLLYRSRRPIEVTDCSSKLDQD